jgi:hypothetical protein
VEEPVSEPEAGEGSPGGWEVVLETSQAYEAELGALRLRDAGVEVRVIDMSYRQEPVPLVRALSLVRVLVPAARAGEARALLAERRDLPEGAGGEET